MKTQKQSSFNQNGTSKNVNKKKTWQSIKRIAGILLIIIGAVGVFLPLIQGVLFIGIGIYLVDNEKLNNWFKKKIPQWKRRLKN